jgi:primosomal protein N' (replication factor Y)
MSESISNINDNTSPLGAGGLFAEIIIPLALPKNYTWSVPALLVDSVQVGCRVEVNLGKNKKYAGVVKHLHLQIFEAKEILNLLDVEPVVFEQQLQLWEWMASYYMCSEESDGGCPACAF